MSDWYPGGAEWDECSLAHEQHGWAKRGKRMSKKVLGVQCRKCHNAIPLTIEHDIYCPNCKALMVVANLVTVDKEEE